MIITSVFAEIPTGAIADMLGKKYTLTVSYLFGFIGYFFMGIADSFTFLALGVVMATISSAFSSGTVEALVYDTLLTEKREQTYQKVLSNISSFKMASLAVSSIFGGILYKMNPGYPFLGLAGMIFIAIFLSLFLKEPPIDSEVFTWSNYIKQNIYGFRELFKSRQVLIKNMLLILLTMFVVVNGHVLIDSQLVEQGWNSSQLGLIVFGMYFVSSIFGQMALPISRRIGVWKSVLLFAVFISLSMVVVPYTSVILGTAVIVLRNGLIELFGNNASATINSETISKYRATTLSTYSMLANIPYVFGAYFIGKYIDATSVHTVTFSIGSGLLLLAILAILFSRKHKLFFSNNK